MRKNNFILRTVGLKTYFFMKRGVIQAVDDVNLEVKKGYIHGLVGESGCGKSVTALSIMRLVSYPGKIVEGEVIYKGKDLLKLSNEEMRRIRGKEIAMIFQDPTSALNPCFTVGDQIMEPILLHEGLSKKEAKEKAIELMTLVGIPSASERLEEYPHQFSGGMRQRVMIAIALSCNPSLLIADEPTTNLDVTIQAQILDLMKTLNKKLGNSILLITHDMGIVAEMCQEVSVMYAGKIVESADIISLFYETAHPYTLGLLDCIPRGRRKRKLRPIRGSVPDLINPPPGCRFYSRCDYATEICSVNEPKLRAISPNHFVACHHPLIGGK